MAGPEGTDRFDIQFIGRPSPTSPRIQAGGHPCQGLYVTPKGRRPKWAVIATHYNVDFSEHYLAPFFAERGFGFLGWNTRFRGAEDLFLLEHALIDIGVGMTWLREEAGVEGVIILGNSGGGSLMGAYQAEAIAPTLPDLARGPAHDALASLPKADLYISLNAHQGRPEVLTDWMDASVTDETDPLATDPALDPFNPDNGPPYSPEFIARYRAAQRTRNQNITDWAKAELTRLNEAGTPDRIFPLFRCWGDLRFVDPTLDPSDRKPGQCYRGDPAIANRSPSIGRANTLRTWLSMWSLETSRCQGEPHLRKFDTPALVIQSLADTGVFPSDARKIFDFIGSKDKQLQLVKGAHYFEDTPQERIAVADLMADWIRSQIQPVRTTIASVRARQIWDSRGQPTVEAEIALAGGAVGRACAPAGASRGAHEALDLRDGGDRFGGKGVSRAVAAVNGEIIHALAGLDAADQAALDRRLETLDGTAGFARLGANATTAVSMAALHAVAAAERQPLWRSLARGAPVRLPMPEIQIFGGGAHAGRRTDVQDFMIMTPSAGSARRALEISAEVYRAAGELMGEAGPLAGVADEGGWWPNFQSNEDALTALVRSIERAGFRPGEDVSISLDIAANELFGDGRYRLSLGDRTLSSVEMVEQVADWARRYPILSIEDPVAQDDLSGMALATRTLGETVQMIGDDLLVTSAERVERAAAAGACNALLVKVNQAGTVTRAKAALDAARDKGWATIVSARSGETEDVTIVHLAVGWNAGQLKVGSFARSERMAKWNELLRIEETLGDDAVFAGWDALPATVAAARGACPR